MITTNLRELPKEAVLAAIGQPTVGSILDRCRTALVRDERESFTATDSPAGILRKSLEVKHRIAQSKGKVLEGGDDLLRVLRDLGDTPVTGVFVDEGPVHYMVYLRAWSLEPLSAVIMKGPLSA